MFVLRIALIKWRFSNTWVTLSVFELVRVVHRYEQDKILEVIDRTLRIINIYIYVSTSAPIINNSL